MIAQSTTQSEIQSLLHKNYPQLAERGLQEEIAQIGKLFFFKAGELITDYGSYIKLIPLVVEGSIKVVREGDDGRELFLYFLQPGEACTMSFTCCMMDKKSEIRVVAEEDTLFIGIPIRYMDEWMSRYQSWKNFVLRSYDNRMLELIKVIDNIIFRKLDDRLMDYLSKKAKVAGTKDLQVTHQEIASDLGATREAVSRLLKQLENSGFLRLGRNKIELLK